MKKVYIGLVAIAMAGTASAQVVKHSTRNVVNKYKNVSEVPAKAVLSEEKGITLWSNDFSTASDWAMSNAGASGSPAHTMGDWTITTDLNAAPVSALKPAAFTTGSNGYAIINSDAAGSGQTQNANIYTTGSINLSANQYVSLVFSQTHRRFQETTYVLVSNDNGVTWNEIEVNANMTTNTNSTNPQTVQVNISTYAGNQSNVKIGFKYVGAYDWFWAVDDVKITATDDYDLTLTGYYWGVEGAWGARLPYYKTPLAQVANIKFGGIVENIGAVTQSDVTFAGAIAAAGYAGTSAMGVVAPNGIDTLDATVDFTPGATASNYTFVGTVTSGATDAAPANNTNAGVAFATNNFIFQRDNGTLASGSYNQGLGFEVGNIYDITADADVYSVDVVIHPNANPGAEMYAVIYSIDATTGEFVYEAASANHTISAADLNAEVNLPLTTAFSMTASTPYLVVVGSYGDGGATDDLVVGTAGVSEAQTSYYLDGNENVGTWYYTTSTPMVRLNFENNLGLNEDAQVALNVYPNPATDNANVSFNLNAASDVAVSVVDLSGKVVATSAVANATAGAHTIAINTAALAAGVYTVNFTANNTIVTKRFVIKK
jgi:hypothetical protein